MVQVTRHLARPFGLSAIRMLVATATLGIAGCTVPTLDRTIFLNASANHPQDLSFVAKRTVRSTRTKCASLNATRLSPAQKDRLFQQFEDWQQDRQNDQAARTRAPDGAPGQVPAIRTADSAPACLNAR